MNSKQKGKRGELEAAEALREHLGIEARRSQQFCGTADSADLKTSLEGVHFECKRTESFSIRNATAQAASECGENVPVVLHKWNRGQWFAIVPLAQLERLAAIVVSRNELKHQPPVAG